MITFHRVVAINLTAPVFRHSGRGERLSYRATGAKRFAPVARCKNRGAASRARSDALPGQSSRDWASRVGL